MESPKDFFISYNHNDRSWAEWLAWTLEDNGYLQSSGISQRGRVVVWVEDDPFIKVGNSVL